MVTDFLIGVIVGAIGFRVMEIRREARNIPNGLAGPMGFSFERPAMNDSFSAYSGMGSLAASFKATDKKPKAEFYELGKIDVHQYCIEHGDTPCMMDRQVAAIMDELETSDSVSEIKYKLELLQKDVSGAVEYLVTSEQADFIVAWFKEMLEWIELSLKAIDISISEFRAIYMPHVMDVETYTSRLDPTSENYADLIIKLGNRLLDDELFREAKTYRRLFEDTDNEKIKDYFDTIFLPRHKEIILKYCS